MAMTTAATVDTLLARFGIQNDSLCRSSLYYRPCRANKFNRLLVDRDTVRCLARLSRGIGTISITLADHVFALIVAIGHPYAGYVSFQRLLARIVSGERVRKTALYAASAATQWLLFALCLLLWLASGRDWAALGFSLQIAAGFLPALLITGAAFVFLILQLRQVMRESPSKLAKLTESLGNVSVILPSSRRELAGFYGLSVTAGIVEETVWRGFMLWYLDALLPLWAAASIAAIGFGLAHAYQGKENLVKVTFVGSVFVLLYLLCGTLWLPMLLHAAVDILQGRTAYEVLTRAETPNASSHK
jgi:membrane protease YdiL (CAAX protease family)